MAWVCLPSTPKGANPVGRTKFPPAPEIAGQTLSPIEVPGLNEWLKALAALKLGPLESECEVVGVLLPTGRILNHLINPTETTTFEKLTFYPKELLPIVNGVLDVVQSSHPALQNLKAALDGVAFVLKTADAAHVLICELKGDADPGATLNTVIG